ncbi:MAG: ketoacyl-ACP synthase III [Clostridia bacterium]|nr:ketoacyl-ACP synthase III [Clostridia bacterium]
MNKNVYFFPAWKKKTVNRYCEIKSTSSYTPVRTLNNEDIIHKYNLPFKSSAIVKSIGVESRHVAGENDADSDILQIAADKCLKQYGLKPDALSRLIVNKFYGDNLLPMTASMLQRKLGSNTAVHAFDVDGGTSSFLHSVDAASRYINTGDDYVLIASGGICNRLISKTDARVAFLFGDAAASILLGHSEEQHILASYFYSNYEYLELAKAIVPFSFVDSGENLSIGHDNPMYALYHMDNWKNAEDFYREAVSAISENLFLESGLGKNDIDLVLITENNRRIWELTLEVLEIGEEKSLSLLKDHGNTMSAMLPLLLDHGFKTGRIQKGMNIMLISHGEGLSGGGLLYKA